MSAVTVLFANPLRFTRKPNRKYKLEMMVEWVPHRSPYIIWTTEIEPALAEEDMPRDYYPTLSIPTGCTLSLRLTELPDSATSIQEDQTETNRREPRDPEVEKAETVEMSEPVARCEDCPTGTKQLWRLPRRPEL